MKCGCGSSILPAHRRRRARVVLALLVLLASCSAAAAHQLMAHAIAGGGGISRSPGGCRTLEGSIGETAVGVSGNAGYTLHAGYWAGAGSVRRESVFRTGFEECQ
ncbi:MAG TPA: hypothetical protein VFS55_07350 [Dokdonella sp.]|nr:hypothetical protein [Dokdonella sp.]